LGVKHPYALLHKKRRQQHLAAVLQMEQDGGLPSLVVETVEG